MKIAVFHNLPEGGAKRVLLEELKYLSKSNKVDLFEINKNTKERFKLAKFTQKRFVYEFSLKNDLSRLLSRLVSDYKNFVSLRFLHKQIAAKIDKGSYDVCLVHPDKYTQAPFLLKYLKTPSVYYCHELLRIAYEEELQFNKKVNFLNKYYERLTRLLRKSIDRKNAKQAVVIISNSKYTKNKVKKAYEVVSEICYPGVDTSVFKQKNLNKTNTLLFVGSKTKINGYPFAKKVLKKLDGFKIKVVGIGSGKNLSDKQLSKEYAKSFATICVSYNEPFGMVAVESMACGTPVLAVNEGGYKETVLDGIAGYLVPRKAKLFAEKIKYLLDNPAMAKKMGRAGRVHVKKNFTWDYHNKNLEKHLKSVRQKNKYE